MKEKAQFRIRWHYVICNKKKTLFVGDGEESCVPFVSQYTDCTEENLCSGCSKCTCDATGKWDCDEIYQCPMDGPDKMVHMNADDDITLALDELERELLQKERQEKAASKNPLVPEPNDEIYPSEHVYDDKEIDLSDEIISLITEHVRSKRATDTESGHNTQKITKSNGTITFHHAIDEINEDTLKNKNASGTISAQNFPASPKITRRSNFNVTSSALQIDNTDNHHDDNKVDTLAIHDDKEDLLVHSNLHHIIGNYTQESKDKELSKILVNELKASELIGEKGAPVISNITFYQENDTLTAMAFIAGNLLNKLWNMEKDTGTDLIDTEVLKHEKISDLVELFKEPLSTRQEIFLKNALDKLSTAINEYKNVDDISLCKKFDEIKKQLQHPKNDDDTNIKITQPSNTNAGTAEALNKITDVLDLLKKYENVQTALRKKTKQNSKAGSNLDTILTDEEKSSLNMYGKTLESLTNLLVPKKKGQKIIHSMRNGIAFSSDTNINRKLPNLRLENLNVTTKDKIVVDYLNHIQSNPDCLSKKQKQRVSPPSIEGDILLNLSEFLKIKSLSDLVKLIETEKPSKIQPLRITDVETSQKPEHESTTEPVSENHQLKETKENLKKHLKSIFNDLIELKNRTGKGKTQANLRIEDALPCLYNLFIDNQEELSNISKLSSENKTIYSFRLGKIRNIFNQLKNELKNDQTRRTNTFHGQRPKSSVVWERVLQNTAGKQHSITRRNMAKIPKTIEELNVILENFDSLGSDTYKNFALLNKVAPSERLSLLKTLNSETLRYKNALDTIHESLQAATFVIKDNSKKVNEFLDNAAIQLKLNEKVISNIKQSNNIYKKFGYILPKNFTRNKPEDITTDKNSYVSKLTRFQIKNDRNAYETKLTRDQIINQLIKNRIVSYIKTKEATAETRNDMNYNIAVKILTNLEIGNVQLARELYKIFDSQTKMEGRKNDLNENTSRDSGSVRPVHKFSSRRKTVLEPLVEFEEPRKVQTYQDQFIKQLINLKNMN